MSSSRLPFEIRRARREDARSMWSVRTRAIETIPRDHYTDEDIALWASSSMPEQFGESIVANEFLAAERDGRIVGWGFLNLGAARIEAVFVRPECQRCGLGSSILSVLENVAREAGLTSLTLSSTLNAVSFYVHAGFQEQKKARFYHPDGFDLDCVVMHKELVAGPDAV